MKSRLLWQIVGIQMLTVGVAILIIGVAVHILAADHFMSLMDKYRIPQDELEGMFLEAVDQYFVGATVAATFVALLMSALLTRQILDPLTRLIQLAREIGRGMLKARATVVPRGELGHLATAFNQMAESLEQTDHLRKTLVANVAHELRTPLTNMRGYLEALRDGVVPSSRETFESLHEETLRVVNLVDDMLRLGRADAAKASLERTPVSLAQLVQRAVDLFRVRLEERQIAIRTELSAFQDEMLLDREKILQVLSGLLDNACRYTPIGGDLVIRSERIGDQVRVVVANSADPIPDEVIPHLFERFYRGERSRSRDHGGAGLGLAIVKELIEAHGGHVEATFRDEMMQVCFDLPSEP